MSFVYIPFNDFYLNVIDILKDTYFQTKKNLYEKIFRSLLAQLKISKQELQKLVDELNNYIEVEDYSIINIIDLDDFYHYIEDSKASIKQLLDYLSSQQTKDSYFMQAYQLVDDIYTLLHQLEDKISVLESYQEIEKLKKAF